MVVLTTLNGLKLNVSILDISDKNEMLNVSNKMWGSLCLPGENCEHAWLEVSPPTPSESDTNWFLIGFKYPTTFKGDLIDCNKKKIILILRKLLPRDRPIPANIDGGQIRLQEVCMTPFLNWRKIRDKRILSFWECLSYWLSSARSLELWYHGNLIFLVR